MALNQQPAKGIFLVIVSIAFALGLGGIFIGILGLSEEQGTLVYAVCFANFWHFGVSFGGWPGGLVTQNRIWRGLINWLLAMLSVLITIGIWSWGYGLPFHETPVALWAQTCIFMAVMQIFLFRNRLITPWDLADVIEWENNSRQPLNGIANFVFAIVFMPTALFFVPTMWGMEPLYIPWYWFPMSVVVVDFCDWWPFDRLGQPRAGILNTGMVIIGTVLLMIVFHHLGFNFFDEGVPGTQAAIFAAVWTAFALIQGWTMNMWPFGHWHRGKKAVMALVITLMISAVVFAAILKFIPVEQYSAVIFWLFAWLWALVCLAAPGYFHLFFWGYEENPHAAGTQGAGYSGSASF